MNITYITEHLNTHEKCVKYLEKKRWNNTPTCPYCGSKKSSQKQLRHTCGKCLNSYSVTVGTVFHSSNLPLQKWLLAIALIVSAKKGISSLQLARDIGVNKNTAWLLQMKIRSAMNDDTADFLLDEKTKKPLLPWENFLQLRKLKRTMNFISTRHLKKYSIPGIKRLVKRALFGQFHQVDEFYLERYIDEVQYKFDRKSEKDNGYDDLMHRALIVSFAK